MADEKGERPGFCSGPRWCEAKVCCAYGDTDVLRFRGGFCLYDSQVVEWSLGDLTELMAWMPYGTVLIIDEGADFRIAAKACTVVPWLNSVIFAGSKKRNSDGNVIEQLVFLDPNFAHKLYKPDSNCVA